MAIAASPSNKVLGITLQGYDQLSPAAKAAMGMIKTLETGAVKAFKAITLPVTILGKAISALLTPLNLVRAAVGFLAARGVVRFFLGAAEDLDIIDKLNAKLGVSTEALQRFRIIADLSGVSLESLSTAFVQMQDRIAGGETEALKSLSELRLSAAELRRLRPEEQFLAIRDAIAAMPTHADRITHSMNLFGRQGAEMLKIFRMSREELERFRPVVIFTEKEIAIAAAFKDATEFLARTWKDLKTTVAIQFFPFLKRGVDAMIEFIRDHLPKLKAGARAVAIEVEFAIRATIEFVKLWKDLLNDRSSAEAFGGVFLMMGGFALETLSSTAKAAVQIVIRMLGSLVEPVSIIGVEVAKAFWLQFDLAGRKALDDLKNSIRGALGLGPDKPDPGIQRVMDDIAAHAASTEQIIGETAQRAAVAFETHFIGIKDAAGGWLDEMSQHLNVLISGFALLAQQNPHLAAFMERLKAMRAEIEAAAAAMDELRGSAGEAAKTLSEWQKFIGGAKSAAIETWERLKDSAKAGEDAFVAAFGAFDSGINSMIDSAFEGTLRITDAFRQMGVEIIKEITKIAIKWASVQFVMSLFGGAGGAAGASASAITAAAGGGHFMTTRPTLLMVGDNPGHKEEVIVRPISGRGRTRMGGGMIRMAGGGSISTGGDERALAINININAVDAQSVDRLFHEKRDYYKREILRAIAHDNDFRNALRGV